MFLLRPSLVVITALVCSPALASRPHNAPLEDVVDQAEVVFEAQVMSYQQVKTAREIRGQYEVQLVDAPDVHARLVYIQANPLVSLATGSGLEHGVKVGQRYVFLARSSGDLPTWGLELLRVEPLEHEDLVMSAWRMSLWRRMATPIELPVRFE